MKIRTTWLHSFACHDKSCAPPPAGTGGSKQVKGHDGPGQKAIADYGLKFSPPTDAVATARAYKDWDSLPTVKMKISDLTATEEYVTRKHIDKVVNGEPLRTGYDPQVVIDKAGKAWIADGHHRAAMHAALGSETMPVKVLDLRTITSSAGLALVLVAACHHRSCAPPPAGTGGSNPTATAAHRAADRILKEAKASEGTITSDIRGVIEGNGGRMTGLRHRIKGLDSLRRKIYDKAAERGISVEEQAGRITDAIRFTGVVSTAKYGDTVHAVIDSLEGKGYVVHSIENHWERGDAYNGIHLLAKHESGATAEVQLHTTQSIRAKNKIHEYYEEFRLPETPKPRRKELFDKMVEISDKAPLPSGIDDVGARVKRPFE